MPHGPAGVFLDDDFEESADAGEFVGQWHSKPRKS